MPDITMIKRFSEAFGPSGFEEDVVKLIGEYCDGFDVRNDAMNNTYVYGPQTSGQPLVMLDAHSDEVGFMVQCIYDNGQLGILMLGGIVTTNIPAHSVLIRTRTGEIHKGITTSKPVHFMSAAERANTGLEIESINIDVGATSRKEVEEVFGIRIGDPVVPDVLFEYKEQVGVCFGKALDDRIGCVCVIEVMRRLRQEQLAVNLVGTFSVQEEVGTRGAAVTAATVKPDLAIVFEATPADDTFFGANLAQGAMKQGVQIRNIDASYIANPVFNRLAQDVGEKNQIKHQMAVRRGGGTNAARISLAEKAVPTLVLGVPARYVHSHYNYCSAEDVESAIEMAVQVIKSLNEETVGKILKKDLLK